jgi:uncharacterized DUF497 family protein
MSETVSVIPAFPMPDVCTKCITLCYTMNNDHCRVILPDLYHSEAEERWLAIGIVNKMLFVVFTERGENTVRLISARTATKAEEKLYHDHSNKIKTRR